MSESTEADKSYEKWINTGANDDDPFWGLFKVKDQMNDALLAAVKYGYKIGFDEGRILIKEPVSAECQQGIDERMVEWRQEAEVAADEYYHDLMQWRDWPSCDGFNRHSFITGYIENKKHAFQKVFK